MDAQSKQNKSFAVDRLPWIVGGVALIFYVFTLSKWVTAGNMPFISRLAGLEWAPSVMAPVHYLVTLPLSLIPPQYQPIALNFLSALFAAITLALLARSVALLPHDRTRDQRAREQSEFSLLSAWWAWVPPLLAVLVCGLQLNFWQNAIADTGEMLDLLMFAYLIRCLLEYRIGENERWLEKFAFVYGISITNNWAMIGFLPLFLIAVVWIKGIEFFNVRFLLKFAGLFALGLLLYLLLPLIAVLQNPDEYSFWKLLKSEIGQQKSFLLFRPFRWPVFLLSLTSLVPLLLISIKWPSFVGDVSPVSNFLNNFMFRVAHIGFWVLCLWVMYEPFYKKALENLPLHFLSFFYIKALCIGYFSGYILLIFGRRPERESTKPIPATSYFNLIFVAAVWAALIIMPSALVYKNLGRIKAMSGELLKKFTEQMVSTLKTNGKPAVLLSDEISLLNLVGIYYHGQGIKDHILIHTAPLVRKDYQKYLARRYPSIWPALTNITEILEPISSHILASQILRLAQSQPVYYLNPSFGYYFEYFHTINHGVTYEMKPYTNYTLIEPPVTEAEIAENEQFWKRFQTDILPVLNIYAKSGSPEAIYLKQYYSRAANTFGVKLQRSNHYELAKRYFGLALNINPENTVARVNLEFNDQLQSKKVEPIAVSRDMWDKFKPLRTVDAIIKAHGQFDHPTYSFVVGTIFFQNNQLRQAATLFERVASLHPDNIEAGLMMGYVYIQAGRPKEALQQVQKLKAQNSNRWNDPTNRLELTRLEASAHIAAKDFNTADKLLQGAIAKNPADPATMQMVAQVYMNFGMLTNAAAIVERQLAINPDDVNALLNKAVIAIQMNQFQKAIEPLTKVLQKQPSNYAALMNRAIAQLQLGLLDEARKDYQRLLEIYPMLHSIHYGLAEIAYRKKDTQTAIKHYEAYLKYAPEGTKERAQVMERLKQLKGTST